MQALNRPRCISDFRTRGTALIGTLLMLLVVMMLGLSATQLALQDEKAARNDRDRQIALQAAEAALLDAEADIEGIPGATGLRRTAFESGGDDAFGAECGRGADNPLLGLCTAAPETLTPVWLRIDLTDTSDAAASVAYGRFTGHQMQTGGGSLPARLPRYLIERLPDRAAGMAADAKAAEAKARDVMPATEAMGESARYLYRITAIGWGPRATGAVVLQSIYRKGG